MLATSVGSRSNAKSYIEDQLIVSGFLLIHNIHPSDQL